MSKGISLLKKISTYLFIFVLLFLFICFLFHQMKLKKEEQLLEPPGKMVEVNQHKMHVYIEGKGEQTLVFMAGLGNVAPTYEFKSLYRYFTADYKVAVVDRPGYGYSEAANDTRRLDTILEETRDILKLSGLKGPYVLFPHSLSGLEAIYWAQKYPNEIKAIVGLDIGLPSDYIKYGPSKAELFLLKTQYYLAKGGLHRLTPSITYNKKITQDSALTKVEKDKYMALSYKQALNKNVLQEFQNVQTNAKKSIALPLPVDTPILLFSAHPSVTEEKEKSVNIKKKNERYRQFVSHFKTSKVINVKGKHSIYLYAPEKISKESKQFLQTIESKQKKG